MKLRIKNVAKIERADLILNGITVIAGNNNTGKSTIGKIVFSLFNSLVNIDEKLEKQKTDLIYQTLLRNTEDILFDSNVDYKFVQDPTPRLRHYLELLTVPNAEEKQKEALREYLALLKNKKVEDEDVTESIHREIGRINHLPTERLKKSVLSAYFNKVFYSEINSAYRPTENAVIEAEIRDKELTVEFADNTCVELRQQLKILNEAVYLDNPFVLNYLNNGSYGIDEIEKETIRKLRKNTDAINDIVQKNLVEEKIRDVLIKIDQVSSGSLILDESRSYLYKDQGISERLNINNLSAGLKSFLIIKTLLENGSLKQKDVLILDEPEIHLHPDWQLCYAEIITLLQKTFDLTIILTTHSSHFMEALQYFAQVNDVKDRCTYYLSETSEFGCRLKDVTSDPTEIYSQLVDASILLDKLRFKMEDAKDE